MIQKKGVSFLTLLMLLLPMEVAAYYLSAVFTFSDLTFANLPEKVSRVFDRFYLPWIWFNEKTLPCMGVGIIVWVFVASYIRYYYRNFQGGLEHGSEDWGDASEITRRRLGKERYINPKSDKKEKGDNSEEKRSGYEVRGKKLSNPHKTFTDTARRRRGSFKQQYADHRFIRNVQDNIDPDAQSSFGKE